MVKSVFAAVPVVLCFSGFASGTVKVSSFGWNGKDDTEALQKALDSGASTVVVDRVEAAWVTRPLRARSNQTVVFERGTVLEAKRGEFMKLSDSLFTCVSVTNVTISGYGAVWKMHRADYDAAPYKKGEWRHSLAIVGSSDVTVEGLTLLESGGDGVYLGAGWKGRRTNCNIVLRDLLCERHYRQGISVITARGLLIERCVTRNTYGTAPAAGIDFEPNHFSEELTDCIVRDCTSENNQGNGLVFFFGQLDSRTRPVSVRVERFRSRNNGRGLSIATHFMDTYPEGLLKFADCSFSNERGAGLCMTRKPVSSVRVVLEKCLFDNCHAAADRVDTVSDIMLRGLRYDDPTTDGLEFRGCTVRTPIRREWFSGSGTSLAGERVHAVMGDVIVETPAGGERVVLDRKWCDARFEPPVLDAWPEKVAFDASAAKLVDRIPGKSAKLSPFKVRGKAVYRFFAPSTGKVAFKARTVKLGRNQPDGGTMTVRDASGKTVAKLKRPGTGSEKFAVAVPAAGFYELSVPVLRHAFVLEESEVPVALAMNGTVNFIASAGDLFVPVPAGAKFVIAVSGGGGNELVHATIGDPSGRKVWDRDGVCDWEAYAGKNASGGLWTVSIRRSGKAIFDDCCMGVSGVQPVAFLSREKYW